MPFRVNGEKYLKSQNLSKYGVENVVAMAHGTLVKVATFGRYCLNVKGVLES